MNLPEKDGRSFPRKPEWKIIIENLVIYDVAVLYRICRKMIIHLERMRVNEIFFYIEQLNPGFYENSDIQLTGPNWPKPKGTPFNATEMISAVFEIADKYVPDDELARLIKLWLHKEKLRNLSKALERRHAPLIEVLEALKKYFDLGGSKEYTSVDERIGVRVSLIHRFFSENLKYINVAKNYITLEAVGKLFNRIVGPAYGSGKVGGKSAGLLLASQILKDKKKLNPKLANVFTPKSWFVTSDSILDFINYNALDDFSFVKYQSLEEIKFEYQFLEYIFKNSPFPPESVAAFRLILEDIKDKPIVVRSSSLLEDSFDASFTGKYKSLFLSNTGTQEERLSALMNAIAEVYASTFGPDPIEYRKTRGLIDFREEMGILIQEVVGNKLGKYFLPSYAGVAFSNNEFRWSPRMKREDGVVRIVAGMGTRAVDRTMDDYPVLICPGEPGIKVNQSTKDMIRYSQQYVDVINLETNSFETVKFTDLIIETKGNIPGIEKIVSFDREGSLVNPVSMMSNFIDEKLVVTFNNLIENSEFVDTIKEILFELAESYGSPIDLEFASDGRKLYLLQCRPQSKFDEEVIAHIPKNIPSQDIVFTADKYINNGVIDGIDFVVYVSPTEYGKLQMAEDYKSIGTIVSKLNTKLPKRKFILMGPGRWGSKGDLKLGVPIIYSDINNTALLIEIALKNADYVPELSFGTHFFQDLVEANIKYLPVYPDDDNSLFNETFFDETHNSITDFLENVEKYSHVVKLINIEHFKANHCLKIVMDGEKNEAIAFTTKKQ